MSEMICTTSRRSFSPLVTLLGVAALFGGAVAAQGGQRLDQPAGLLPGMETEPGEVDLRETPIVRAVRRAKDSVVNVYLTRDVRSPFGGRERSVVQGQGSGVILDAKGLVITNWHVTLGNELEHGDVVCALNNGETYPARLLASSADHDLALLQLDLPDKEALQPIALGDSDSLMIGETVIAIGNPQGRSNSVTAGVLSAIDREIRVRTPDGAPRTYTGLLQTDAAINQGNSGGALLDITGKLIGINNAMQRDVENIGFAIPVNTVRRVFDEVLLESDNVQTAWLGMSIAFPDGASFAVAEDVVPAGPAARAGIRAGDHVRALDGSALSDRVAYLRAVSALDPDRLVRVDLARGDERLSVKVDPLSREQFEVWRRVGLELERVVPDEGAPNGDRELVRAVSLAWAKAVGGRAYMLDGVLRVRSVVEGGPADDIGVEAGDLLLAMQGIDFRGRRQPVIPSDIGTFADRLRGFSGRNLPIVVLRGDKELDGKIFVRRL